MLSGPTITVRVEWPERAGYVVISVPDFSVVPAAHDYGGPERLRPRIDAFNEVARLESAVLDFRWIDLTDISRTSPAPEGWLAEDQLHPSDAQYAAWADRIWSLVAQDWS